MKREGVSVTTIPNEIGLQTEKTAAALEKPKLLYSPGVLLGDLVTRRETRSRASELPVIWSQSSGSAAWVIQSAFDRAPFGSRGLVVAIVPSALPPDVPSWSFRDLPPGWAVVSLWDHKAEAPQVKWAHHDGRHVTMISAGIWFGSGQFSEGACRRAESGLRWALAHGWEGWAPAVRLAPTPATTGRLAWLSHLPATAAYPVLSLDAQDWLRATTPQGRVQYLPNGPVECDRLYELDTRLAYLSLCRNLPTGQPVVLTGIPTGDDRHRNWRALVSWEAPGGWAHLGLLPERRSDGGWHYPLTGAGWVDRSEYLLAERCGWSMTCGQAVLWPGKGDPLGAWADRMIAAIEWADELEHGTAGMVAHALRHVSLDALGAFHGTPRLTTRTADVLDAGAVPDGAAGVRIEGDLIAYEAPHPNGWAAKLAHPEWTAAIWARCRVRMLDGGAVGLGRKWPGSGALGLDPATIAAVMTDALILTDRTGQLQLDRAPGVLRLKSEHVGPFSIETPAQLLAAMGKGPQ